MLNFQLFVAIAILITSLNAVDGTPNFLSAIEEIQENGLISKVIHRAANIVYDDTEEALKQPDDKQQLKKSKHPRPNQADKGHRLKFFHNNNAALYTEQSFFTVKDKHNTHVEGYIYNVDDVKLKGKIFITFRGSKTPYHWFKNLFEIVDFKRNIQKSYYEDIELLLEKDNSNNNYEKNPFITTLKLHISSDKSYEYYFIGHSHGGTLAFLAAHSFKLNTDLKRIFKINNPNQIKVITFSAPKLINSQDMQSTIINNLGFDNIVHFINPYDIAPEFPFGFINNPGKTISFNSGFFPPKSHSIKNERVIRDAIDEFNEVRDLDWKKPFIELITPNFKNIIWGIGAIYGFKGLVWITTQSFYHTAQALCYISYKLQMEIC